MIEIVAAMLIGAAAPSYAQPSSSDTEMTAEEREAEVRDRVEYRRLTREIIRLDRTYAQKLAEAVERARSTGSEDANLEQQADMLSLRDKRDRLHNRLLLLSLRHGWEVPDFEAEAAEQGEIVEGKAAVFARSNAMIRAEFAREAEEIAASIELPIIGLTVER